MQARRKGDLRLVVMSATLDAAKFVTYFAGSRAVYLQVCLTSIVTCTVESRRSVSYLIALLAQPCIMLVSVSLTQLPAVCMFLRIMHSYYGSSFAGPAVPRECLLYRRARGELPGRCPGDCHAGISPADALGISHICTITSMAPRAAAPTLAAQVHAEEAPGDILVFLTGQDEIESLARLVSARCAAMHVLRSDLP